MFKISRIQSKLVVSSIERLVLVSILISWAQHHASAEVLQRKLAKVENSTSDAFGAERYCSDCRLTADSIDSILRKPRQLDAYGQIEDRLDLERIKKGVCKDIVDDRDRENCRSFFFAHLDSVEKWVRADLRVSFRDYVCIKELKFCCPSNSFGPRCLKCNQCNQNQHCNGEGTRSGDGSCVCNLGHSGPSCTSCNPGYYQENNRKDSSKLLPLCKQCHRSCVHCSREGSLGCEVCKSGFTWLPAYGCSDIDECVQNKKICGDNTFCVNTEGSYFCYECDRACDGCHGDGPDMCLKCAKGYSLEKGNCVPAARGKLHTELADYYRYGIYLGMCISTCIILHNNVYLASLVGLGVALYIGVSEYVMSTRFTPPAELHM